MKKVFILIILCLSILSYGKTIIGFLIEGYNSTKLLSPQGEVQCSFFQPIYDGDILQTEQIIDQISDEKKTFVIKWRNDVEIKKEANRISGKMKSYFEDSPYNSIVNIFDLKNIAQNKILNPNYLLANPSPIFNSTIFYDIPSTFFWDNQEVKKILIFDKYGKKVFDGDIIGKSFGFTPSRIGLNPDEIYTWGLKDKNGNYIKVDLGESNSTEINNVYKFTVLSRQYSVLQDYLKLIESNTQNKTDSKLIISYFLQKLSDECQMLDLYPLSYYYLQRININELKPEDKADSSRIEKWNYLINKYSSHLDFLIDKLKE